MQSLKDLTIRIDPLFWVLALGLGFYYSGSFSGIIIWAAIVLISVLCHELGHALTAQFFGQRASITLTFFGGVTNRDGPPISKWKEFLIVLNGPLAGFLLGLAALWTSSLPILATAPILRSYLNITYVINLFWTFINLFPIQPLDGGHLLSIVLQGVFGYRGIKIAYFVSGLLAILLGFFFFFFQQVFLGAIFLLFAFDSFRNWKSSLIMSRVDHSEDLREKIKASELAISEGRMLDAKNQLMEILRNHKDQGGILVLRATELLARIYYEEENAEEAYQLLAPYQKSLDLEGSKLLQHLALKSHHDLEALNIGTKIHQEEANSETALINALASAKLKNSQATLGWLKTAIDEGLPNPQVVLQNSRFDFVKSLPEFQNLLKS